jgi:hypothetical protein
MKLVSVTFTSICWWASRLVAARAAMLRASNQKDQPGVQELNVLSVLNHSFSQAIIISLRRRRKCVSQFGLFFFLKVSSQWILCGRNDRPTKPLHYTFTLWMLCRESIRYYNTRCYLHGGFACFSIMSVGSYKKKVKQSHYRLGQALRAPRGSGSQIFRQSTHEGGKVVSPTHRPPLPPGKIPGTHFC